MTNTANLIGPKRILGQGTHHQSKQNGIYGQKASVPEGILIIKRSQTFNKAAGPNFQYRIDHDIDGNGKQTTHTIKEVKLNYLLFFLSFYDFRILKVGKSESGPSGSHSAQQNRGSRPTTDLQSSLSRAQLRSDSYAHALAHLSIDSA